jgi:NAD(P)-dependent dehydrogenase (short-subunit alcohol dehydrogenase family)
VRPGVIETDIHASAGDPGRVARVASSVPIGRGGTADEVAETVLWLCSPQASYVTGVTIDVAGGRGL